MTLTFAETPEDLTPPDFKRDQWGRPSIMQPNGKRKGYTRCSSAAKTIEDTFNLEKWARRNIAYGMAYDASLVARVIAIGGEPSAWGKAEKDQVNAILEAADAVAKAHKRADIGTAVHHLTHRFDRGEEVIAGPYQADVDAYATAMQTHRLQVFPHLTECRMVNDLLEMAGTADRIVADGDLYRVADIKTGASIDFGGLGWAAQLAAYAGGLLYDVETEQRIDTPPIDPTIGYIIHLPAGEGRCDIYQVDLVAGHRAAELANEIRAVRKASKTWITPCSAAPGSPLVEQQAGDAAASPAPNASPRARGGEVEESGGGSPQQDVEPASCSSAGPAVAGDHGPLPAGSDSSWRFEAKRRYDQLNDTQKADYTARKTSIDTSNRDAVFRLLAEVDPIQTIETSFTPPLPARPEANPPAPPDEGGTVTAADVDALKHRFDKLPLNGSLWTGRLIAEGNKAHTFRIKDKPTVRRYEIYRGILALAEHGVDDDDVVRGLLYGATGREETAQETMPLGAAISTLNATEATQFALACVSYCGMKRGEE